MSNRAVEQQNFDAKEPFAGLALVTKPVPKAEPGHVVRITLRPINPTNLLSIRSNTLRIPGSKGFGIVHEVGEGMTTSGICKTLYLCTHPNFFNPADMAHIAWHEGIPEGFKAHGLLTIEL